MVRELEEKIHSYWRLDIKDKTFESPYMKKIQQQLETWRTTTYSLLQKYYETQEIQPRAGKSRFAFDNSFKFCLHKAGEYFVLMKDFLKIFARGRLPVIIKNVPIFVSLKAVPVFWINGGLITPWNFYFEEEKVDIYFKEVMQFANKLINFDYIEFSYFNFIETYSSKPESVIDFDQADIEFGGEGKKFLDTLSKYLSKDFWIIPKKSLLDASPLSFIIFTGGVVLPCMPYRIIFKVLKVDGIQTINVRNTRIDCRKVKISYPNASLKVKEQIVYFPFRYFKNVSLRENKIYNGLIFSFVDFINGWIYPVLFSFYEEDLQSYEVFQELLVILLRNKFLLSENLFSIVIDKNELLKELKSFAYNLYKSKLLSLTEQAFMKLDDKNMIDLLLAQLYPILLFTKNRIYYIPLPVGLLNISKDKMEMLIEYCENMKWKSITDMLELGELLKTSVPNVTLFIRSFKQRMLLVKYFKELITYVEASIGEDDDDQRSTN
jgi:hypothetical protein